MNEFSERLGAVCERHAARVAVLERGQAFTYAQLERRVEQVASTLRDAGLGRGALVALAGDRSFARIADLAALWRVGASPLLLCPRWPADYRQRCVAGSGAQGVLRAGALSSETFGPAPPLPPDLAYLVYTSGSGGAPKGVLVPHAGLVPVLDAQIEAFGLSPQSRSLFLLGLGFDASLSDIGTALLAGASLVIEDDAACAPGRVLGTMAKRGVTYADVPPVYLGHMDERALPGTLETVVVGGEVPPAEDVRRLAGRVVLLNVYGPSEATICTSVVRCDERWSRPLIGRPIAGNHYALRAGGVPVAGGRAGELLISGPAVAYGYLGDAALSALRFAEADGRRVFRTGDRVLARADGEWEFLGRVDRQLKRRGQLVAPEEVEAALLRTGLVRAASVTLASHTDQLVACVEPRAAVDLWDQPAFARRVREQLLDALPPGLVPDRVEVVRALTRGSNGKLRHAQAQGRRGPLESRPSLSTRVSPGDSLDRGHEGGVTDAGSLSLLGAFMGEALGCAPLAPDDDFYERGGDSLRALEVVARAEAAGWELRSEWVPRGRSPRGTLALAREGAPGVTRRAVLDARLGAAARQGPRLDLLRLALGEARRGSLRGARVLVTGATGALGRALLPLLLARLGPEGTVHALVRRPDALLGLGGQGGRPASTDARLLPELGDIRDARLGLARERYAELATTVDAVMHLAAYVGSATPSDELHATNVDGTRHVLRFVAEGRPKALLHASTLSVLCEAQPRPVRCHEDDRLDATESLATPYAASKWVAERLVRIADPSESAVTVVRLGLLTGESATGHGAEQGHLARFIRGLAALSALPVLPAHATADALAFDVTPVDHAARACLALFERDHAHRTGGTYHVAAPRPATLAELCQAMRAEGVTLGGEPWPLLCVRAGQLRVASTAAGQQRAADAALAILSLCRVDSGAFARHRALDLFAATGTHFSLVNTQRALAHPSTLPPQPDLALLRRYVRSALA